MKKTEVFLLICAFCALKAILYTGKNALVTANPMWLWTKSQKAITNDTMNLTFASSPSPYRPIWNWTLAVSVVGRNFVFFFNNLRRRKKKINCKGVNYSTKIQTTYLNVLKKKLGNEWIRTASVLFSSAFRSEECHFWLHRKSVRGTSWKQGCFLFYSIFISWRGNPLKWLIKNVLCWHIWINLKSDEFSIILIGYISSWF